MGSILELIFEPLGCYIRWKLSGTKDPYLQYWKTNGNIWIDATIGIAVLALVILGMYEVARLLS